MDADPAALPDEIDTLKAALVAARAEVAAARVQHSDDQVLIAHLKLEIEKLNRDRYGPRSERAARLLDQLELQLEEAEASATEDELAAEMAASQTSSVAAFVRKRPARKPFRSTCRANGSSFPGRRLASAAAAHACPSWARMS